MILLTDDEWRPLKRQKKCFICYQTFKENTEGSKI